MYLRPPTTTSSAHDVNRDTPTTYSLAMGKWSISQVFRDADGGAEFDPPITWQTEWVPMRIDIIWMHLRVAQLFSKNGQ